MLRILALVLASSLIACEEEPQQQPPPKPPSDDWFALAHRRCFTYKREAGGLDVFSVLVEGPDTAVVQDVPLWKTTWRRNGLLEKEEWWEAAPDALLLRRRQVFDQASGVDRIQDYDPPPALMLVDGVAGAQRATTPTVRDRLAGEEGTTRRESWSLTVFAPRSITAAGQSVQAPRAVVTSSRADGSSAETTTYYFMAQRGLLAYDPPGTSVELLVLDAVTDEAAQCPPPW